MTRTRSTRRGVAVLAVAVVALLAALAGPAGAQDAGEGLIPEGDWTNAQVAELLALIDATEAALPAKFPTAATRAELDTALGDMGYYNFGVTAPGGYDHWINPGWLFDEHLIDPEFPESLVYELGDDDKWHLVSAMFMLDPAIGMDDIPEDIAWLPGWHGHPELCTHPNGTFGGITDPESPSCPPGTSQATTPVMMHVWIVDNACEHRFGGVGVGGLHCDHTGHDDPGHDDPGHDDPGHDDPGHDDPGHDDPIDPSSDPATGGTPVAPGAVPVVVTPTYTG